MFETTTAIYSAIGDDGVHYTFEPGIRFSSDEAVYDVAGIYFNNQWLLTAPDGPADNGARWATSTDGLNFTQADENIPSVGNVNWTGNLLLFDDGLRFYGGASTSTGTWWTESSDGETWADPTHLDFKGFDPAVVQTSAEDYLIIYVQ